MSDAIIYAASYLLNPDVPPVAAGALLVENGIIRDTGTLAELRRAHNAPIADFPGFALLPGFVNAHTHLELTHFPAWLAQSPLSAPSTTFAEWIIRVIKIKRGVIERDHCASLREGIRICLESGTTCVGDISSNPSRFSCYGDYLLGGRVYRELLGHDPAATEALLRDTLTALDTLPPPLFPGLSPHSPYTVSAQIMAAIGIAASQHSLPLALHLAESPEEVDFIFDTSGPLAEILYPYVNWTSHLTTGHRCSPVDWCDRAGLLSPRTLAVHCVHLTLADARLLHERGVHVALCPRSNEQLQVGKAPVSLLKKCGVPLSLGTDSLASNDSLSLWDELHFALDAFPHDLSPAELFAMVTVNGAAALHLEHITGSLVPGKRADFQVVPLPHETIGEQLLLERILTEGKPQEVYAGGIRFTGNCGLTFPPS